MLPTYQRISGTSQPPNPLLAVRRSFRSSEKCLILLVLLTFGFVCFGGFFFLPDNFGADRVLKVYKQFQRAGPEIFIPPPPPAHGQDGDGEDWHKHNDRAKLQEKIQKELPDDFLEKPELDGTQGPEFNNELAAGGGGGAGPMNPGGPPGVVAPPQILEEPELKGGPSSLKGSTSLVGGFLSSFNSSIGEDSDPAIRDKRNQVKEMMSIAWNGYKRFAWGQNELRPISMRAHTGNIFGTARLGATIVDAMDTLYLMGMHKDFDEGRDWIANSFTLDNVPNDLSVFETNIRFIGGFLTCYAFTGDRLFLEKAKYVADKLLPAFNTPTGIPYALINVNSGISKNYGWASGGCSILSEFGTLSLEFAYLSDITGDPVYRERVMTIRNVLKEIEKPKGLYPNYLNPKTGKWCQMHMSMGALGDSFYEYLLKAWIQSGQEDEEPREMYDEAMQAIIQYMIRTSPGGLMYVSDLKYDRLEHKMDHLACFAGGLFGLASKTRDNQYSEKYMEIAEGLANTCHESYVRAYTRLGPEAFRFNDGVEAKALKSQEKYYILRPEVVETYFVMWRLTKNPKYREWGWDMVQALEKYCKTPNGYSGVKNVYLTQPQQDDVQQSFFLAETLKYLYLLFSDDRLVSLDQWVMNTEAHPLPIKGSNSWYRSAAGEYAS